MPADGSGEGNRCVFEHGQLGGQVVFVIACVRDVLGKVPLVDDDDTALVFLGDLPGQPLVYLGQWHGRIDEEPDDVGPLDGASDPDIAVEFDIIGHLALLADAGRVDDDEGLAVLLDAHVHRVPSRPRDLADDDTLAARDGVDHGTLARVALAHHGDLHHRFRRGVHVLVIGQPLEDAVEQHRFVEVVLSRDAEEVAEAEPGELARPREHPGVVGLVGDADHIAGRVCGVVGRSSRPAESVHRGYRP